MLAKLHYMPDGLTFKLYFLMKIVTVTVFGAGRENSEVLAKFHDNRSFINKFHENQTFCLIM